MRDLVKQFAAGMIAVVGIFGMLSALGCVIYLVSEELFFNWPLLSRSAPLTVNMVFIGATIVLTIVAVMGIFYWIISLGSEMILMWNHRRTTTSYDMPFFEKIEWPVSQKINKKINKKTRKTKR